MIGERSVCNVCGTLFDAAQDRLVEVRCNIRRFARETFDLWRCTRCRCIHCRQIVDLPRYYEGYGTKDQRLDFFSRLLRRIRAAGLRPMLAVSTMHSIRMHLLFGRAARVSLHNLLKNG